MNSETEHNILIIEDDIQLTFFIKKALEREGYNVSSFYNGEDGLNEALKNVYSLILLDINLPVYSGMYICKKIRELSEVPIIFFTAQDRLHERVEGLDAGANDYIVKPVEVSELLARVRANLRTKSNIISKHTKFQFNHLSMDINTRMVNIKDTEFHLSPKEFDILLHFMKNPNITLTKQQIFEGVWQNSFNNQSDKRVIDEHINNLRKKIHLDNYPKLLHTVYGIGYILK